ncbi:hypothetical protein J6590_030079 [Homalodisca vitripennis]|nr:hypothetical protein J6590_030079 [Homalodisca vitripennis]
MRNGKEWLGQSRCRESSRAELLSSGSPLLKRVCRMMGYDKTNAEWKGVARSIQMSGEQSSGITE